jgi:DNA-binding phage protein
MAEDLTSDIAVATIMAEAFETEDSGYIARALGVAARAKGASSAIDRSAPKAIRHCKRRLQS